MPSKKDRNKPQEQQQTAKAEPKKQTKKAEMVPVTAPMPKNIGSRPTLAESKKRAQAARDTASSSRPGQILNCDKTLEYYYWDALELSDERQVRLRLMLGERGYWKADGAEHVSGVPHAEIWCIYKEAYETHRRASEEAHKKAKRRIAQGM